MGCLNQVVISAALLHDIVQRVLLPPFREGGAVFPGQANLQTNFFSFSSCCNHQTFHIRLATFKITQILSPERASERKGMSSVEQFIWVNLYSRSQCQINVHASLFPAKFVSEQRQKLRHKLCRKQTRKHVYLAHESIPQISILTGTCFCHFLLHGSSSTNEL